MRLAGRLVIVLLYVFLLAPIGIVLLTSFSNDAYLAFPPAHWGLGGYTALYANRGFRAGLETSLLLGAAVTLLTLLCGTAAAYAIARFRFAGAGALLAFFTAPLLLPTIVLGLALLLVFAQLGLLASFTGLVIGHALVAIPYVIRLMLTAISGVPPTLEEAAATLGATPLRIFWRVTLPSMRPALLAAAALAFLASFDEVTITLFLVGPRLTTLPVAVFRYLQDHADPQVSALSVVLIVLTVGVIALIERSLGLMRAVSRADE
jgi:putative spermidine/putrescine transport system permease protein